VVIHDGTTSTQGFLSFDTKDLSIGGAFLEAGLLLEVDEVLSLELHLGERKVVRAKARVVRISQDPPGMGISFTDLADKDREALRTIVQQRGIKS
jgi:hypothetical protein